MPRPRAEKPTYSLTLRSGRYYVQWWESGAARRRACGTGSLAEARRFLAAFDAEVSAPVVPESPTVGQIVDGYLADRGGRRHSPTLGYNITRLRTILGDLPVDLLNKERIRHYCTRRRKAGAGGAPAPHRAVQRPLADATLRRELLTLRTALNWAVKERWIAAAPHIEAPGPGRPRDRWLTREEVERLIEGARQPHVKVFLGLAFYTGARMTAILELTWERVDFGTGIIDLGEGHGKKRRARVPLHPRLRPVLDLAHEIATTPYVVEKGGKPIRSVKTGIRAAAKRAGLEAVTSTVVRHTVATHMAQQGVPLAKIAGYLGNSLAAVEKNYAHHHPAFMADAAAALD